MNTATSDPTLTETGIPWAFRCVADDRQQSYALARLAFLEMGLERVVILRSNDRYGRFGVGELRDAARRVGNPIVAEVQWRTEDEDFGPLIDKVVQAKPDGVILWGGPIGAAKALRLLRESDKQLPVFGPARLGFDRFLEEAGEAAEGVVVATTLDPTSQNPRWLEFKRQFEGRYGEWPDAPAAHGYDGMQMVIDAIRRGGLNRVRIRHELAAIREYEGVSGLVLFDNTFNDVGTVYLAEVKSGRFVFRPAPTATKGSAKQVIGLLRPLAGEGAIHASAVERGVRLALHRSRRAWTLEIAGTRGPWSTVGEVARDLIEERGAVGLITALDSQGAHVAAQVATRLRRPLAVAGDSPALLAHTGVPWILSSESPVGPSARAGNDRHNTLESREQDSAVKSGYFAALTLLEALHPNE